MSKSGDGPSEVDVATTGAQGGNTEKDATSPKEKSSRPPSLINDSSSDFDSSTDEELDEATRKMRREWRKKYEKRGKEKGERKFEKEKENLSMFGYHQVPHDYANTSPYPSQIFHSVNLESLLTLMEQTISNGLMKCNFISMHFTPLFGMLWL